MVPGYVWRPHAPPPAVPQWLLEEPYHVEYSRWNIQNPEYIEWVRQEVRELNQKYEEFAYVRDWDAFTAGGEHLLAPTDVVAVVACSPARLPFVKRMLKLWQGPMALAIFIPTPAGSARAAACRERLLTYAQLLARESQAPFALSFFYANEDAITMDCNLQANSTGLESPWIDHERWNAMYAGRDFLTIFDAFYPTNHGRNLVVNMVQTNAFVFLLDADFVPSGTAGQLYASLQADAAMARMRQRWEARREREVLIIPAFERLAKKGAHPAGEAPVCASPADECWVYEGVEVPFTKAKLSAMVYASQIESFYHARYHLAYDCYEPYDRWLTATEEYNVTLTPECEPFIIGLRAALPQYDQRFRGAQIDKVSFLQHLSVIGTSFTVHPTYFIIHLPHRKSHSVDDGIDTLPAKYDRWTVTRVLEAQAIGEKAEAAVLEALLKGNMRPEDAAVQAEIVGREYARRQRQYRLDLYRQPGPRVRQRIADTLRDMAPFNATCNCTRLFPVA